MVKEWNVWAAIDNNQDAAYLKQQAAEEERLRLIAERTGTLPVSWQDAVQSALNDEHVSYHRSYYEPGELATEAIVITVARISDENYLRLANGTADYVSTVEGYEIAEESGEENGLVTDGPDTVEGE